MEFKLDEYRELCFHFLKDSNSRELNEFLKLSYKFSLLFDLLLSYIEKDNE